MLAQICDPQVLHEKLSEFDSCNWKAYHTSSPSSSVSIDCDYLLEGDKSDLELMFTDDFSSWSDTGEFAQHDDIRRNSLEVEKKFGNNVAAAECRNQMTPPLADKPADVGGYFFDSPLVNPPTNASEVNTEFETKNAETVATAAAFSSEETTLKNILDSEYNQSDKIGLLTSRIDSNCEKESVNLFGAATVAQQPIEPSTTVQSLLRNRHFYKTTPAHGGNISSPTSFTNQSSSSSSK